MAQFYPRRRIFPEGVRDLFKYEVAEEIGVTPQIVNGYWGGVTSRDCGHVGGKIGGNMVRAMIRFAEEALARGQDLS